MIGIGLLPATAWTYELPLLVSFEHAHDEGIGVFDFFGLRRL